MKTQNNNNQETGRNQVSNLVIYSSAIIFSAVLLGNTSRAQNSWDYLSSFNAGNKVAALVSEQPSETKQADATFELIDSESNTHKNNSNQTSSNEEPSLNSFESYMESEMEYNPEKFVNAEMELEIERLSNNNETVEAETNQQIEILTNEIAYKADRFVEKEMELEINNEEFLKSAEATTAIEAEQEITKYADKITNKENENMAQVESNSQEAEFYQEAEQYTAIGVDSEIAKYSEKLIYHLEAEENLALESYMTETGFLMEAEQITANGSDQEIDKYAEKIINNNENGLNIAIENWMPDFENFNNQSHYEHLVVN